MNIHLRWGIRRRRTQRRRPEIQHNGYATNLLQWGLSRQRIQKNRRPRKPPTRIDSVTRTSSDALPHSVVQHLNLSGHANDVVQPVQVVRQYNLIASTSNTTALTSFGPLPQSVVGHVNLNASTSNTVQPLLSAVSLTIDPFGGRRSITVFGYEDYNLRQTEDYNLRQTKEFLNKQNSGIVIRDESELNMMLKHNMNNSESNASHKGKGKGKENQAPTSPVYWPDKVNEWRRIHSTRLRGWGIDNTVYVMTELRWPSLVGIDTSTFRRIMYRTFGRF
ncbi:hypothetical protein LguiA_032614 [Lonicera macranthoides]